MNEGLTALKDFIELSLANFKVSLDRDLADIRQTLAQHDRRFDRLDRKLDEHDQRFDAVDRRFDAMDQRFDEVDRRAETMDGRLHEIASDVAGLKVVVRRLDERRGASSDDP